jgi:hypothetical protein
VCIALEVFVAITVSYLCSGCSVSDGLFITRSNIDANAVVAMMRSRLQRLRALVAVSGDRADA